ncbi:mannosyltransferase [Gaetbulibacter aestuarii]|uniref:Mannosyltransferase n=1 Tax=Gaetbulibacter aestuarii TaxID=1502358 RepID=A0ABW7MXJ0_9FLAO
MLGKSSYLNNKVPIILLVLLSTLFYWSFAYDLERTDYFKLLSLYFGLFVFFIILINKLKDQPKVLTWLAFGFRAIFLLSIPNLSQDFYRFIWDGRIILEGFNPFIHNVENFISSGLFPVAQAETLYHGMGVLNASHLSNYPPINQWCFIIAALLANKSILGSVIILRLILIAADFGTLYFGKKLLKLLGKPEHLIFWYILNPFIIIELTGNLHFDGLMIFFLIWSLYLLHLGKWGLAAIPFAASISVKLMPLLFLPLFFQWFRVKHNKHNETEPSHLRVKRLLVFYFIIGIITLALFAPFYSRSFFENYLDTVALWFQKFEFNASLYYIARAIGYGFRGYNEIATIGKWIAIIVFLAVMLLAVFRKNKTMAQLITTMLFALSFYYFTATTVHPWYIATLLFLSIFTRFKFPLVWSAVIFLSYLAYLHVDDSDKSENLIIISIEYGIVYGVFLWELFIKKGSKSVT